MNTRKIRIAVAVNHEGEWDSRGWGFVPEDEHDSVILESLIDDGVASDWDRPYIVWVTAEVPVPSSLGMEEVAGSVEQITESEANIAD